MLLPNLITLLALCAGLTGDPAGDRGQARTGRSAAIVFAAVLDGIDGRVARMLKGTSRFGAELDSLADFVNFGVAPALILYFWGLHELGNRRLDRRAGVRDLRGPAARALQRDDRRSEQAGLGRQFLHRHAGAGRRASPCCCRSICSSSACRKFALLAPLVFVYTLAIALLMVSRLPVFSGKRVGKRVPPEMVLPIFVLVVLFFALLITYPWEVLATGTVLYLASLPFGVLAYRKHQRADAAAAQPAQPAVASLAGSADAAATSPAVPPDEAERPARLN